METRTQRRRGFSVVVMLAAVGVMALACAKSDPSSSPDATAKGGSADTSPDLVQPVGGTPKSGGKMVYGLEAETDGWSPATNRWANSGTQVGLAIFDPLVALDKDFQPKPYLAESLTPNSDFTQWTVKLRPNIKFHDGTPLNSAALVKSVNAFKASPLTGAAAKPITKVEQVDDLSARFFMEQPWAVWPFGLTGQAGVVPAPAQIDDPSGSQRPIGTGPFVFKDWKPNTSLSVEKNPNYWRQGLPYIQAVEFRPIVDTNTRYESLLSGAIDLMVTSSEQTIRRMLEDGKAGTIQVTRSKGQNDTSMVLINNQREPVNDVRVRQAMAYAINRPALAAATDTDPSLAADSVFQPDTIWYQKQDYPPYDLEKAKQLVQQVKAEKGPVKFTFGSSNDPATLNAVQVIARMWNDAGIETDIKTFEQTPFIINAITGQYQAQIWRQFGSVDPDPNYIWWISSNADGEQALNMARNRSAKVDEALKAGRATNDVEKRKVAYNNLQQQFTDTLPYIWLNHLRWTAGANNSVRGLQGGPLPDGSTSTGLVGGVIPITAMWLDR